MGALISKAKGVALTKFFGLVQRCRAKRYEEVNMACNGDRYRFARLEASCEHHGVALIDGNDRVTVWTTSDRNKPARIQQVADFLLFVSRLNALCVRRNPHLHKMCLDVRAGIVFRVTNTGACRHALCESGANDAVIAESVGMFNFT
ncbi:unannotated protein [freshwater metagenome]|uniref:Unannotated protein n=1 Tax=freshwater metagenome TaxID=449393 RepID=A0A6J6MB32_9ZZZZ